MRLRPMLVACLLVAAASNAQAGKTDAFIEFGSIKGESTDRSAEKGQHIDLLSYSFGQVRRVSKVDSLAIKQNGKVQGSVTVAGGFEDCRVGTAYTNAVIQSADARYELKDIVVAACTPDGLSLNYGSVRKVRVKGWDPEKKEL